MTYDHCPYCNSTDIEFAFSAKDYTVTGEQFKVFICNNCGGYLTQDGPCQQQIGRYYQSENYISHSDTSKGLVNRLYHLVRNFTLIKKKNLLQKYLDKKYGSVLDIGSGTGAFLNTMKNCGWQITGIEPDATARENSKVNYGIEALQPDQFNILPDAAFDAITMWHVLEHVHDLSGQMMILRRLVKPGGKIFIAVPNPSSADAKYYGPAWAAWDVPRHLYHFTPAAMKTLAGRFGFQVVNIHPMWFDSFYVSLLSEKYKSGKNNFIGGVLRGFSSNVKAFSKKEACSSLIYVLEPAK